MPKSSSVSPLMSATRIVSTLGPATTSERTLRAMMKAGVDVFRFNMSHGDHAFHADLMTRVRRVAAALDRPVGILVDLQGPKVRTQRNVAGEPIPLSRNESISITFGRGTSEPGHVVVDFPGIADDLRAGDRLLFDDGKLVLTVTRAAKGRVAATVVRGGKLKERAGVNVPGRALNLIIPTTKDRRDAKFALAQEADFVALSFVQSAADVVRLKKLLDRELRGKKQRRPAVVAKIEKPAALEQIDEILHEADGVMVARGDLGVELSLEKVPVWQKKILSRARLRGRFTITATQMLESMIQSPSPTRAEVSDVANAVLDGTDAVMLSAETAIGAHPVESVKILTRIAAEVDDDFHRYGPLPIEPESAIATEDREVEAVVRARGRDGRALERAVDRDLHAVRPHRRPHHPLPSEGRRDRVHAVRNHAPAARRQVEHPHLASSIRRQHARAHAPRGRGATPKPPGEKRRLDRDDGRRCRHGRGE